MLDRKRRLYVLKPDAPERVELNTQLMQTLAEFVPEALTSEDLAKHALIDGNVLLVPAGTWRPGVLSELTRFTDLSFVALVTAGEHPDRVGLLYVLGADLVLDETASPAVLQAAVRKLMDVEISGLRPQLTNKESLLFETLRKAGRAGIDRETLAEKVWSDVSIHKKTIDVHMFNLRRKLGGTKFRIVCEGRRFAMFEDG